MARNPPLFNQPKGGITWEVLPFTVTTGNPISIWEMVWPTNSQTCLAPHMATPFGEQQAVGIFVWGCSATVNNRKTRFCEQQVLNLHLPVVKLNWYKRKTGSQFPAKIHASSNFRNTYVDVYYICRSFLISLKGYGFSVFPFVITCILHPKCHFPVLFLPPIQKEKKHLSSGRSYGYRS